MITPASTARKEIPDRNSPDWDRAIALMGLEAQVQLLPYALGFFGISLPILMTVVGFAHNGAWFFASMALYAVNWAIFYAVLDWRKSNPANLSNLRLHTAVHISGGLLWAIALFQTAFYAKSAGPLAELLLILCAGAAVAVIFFSSPSLPSLLLVGPTAALGPVAALRSNPETATTGIVAICAAALALALGLILNRHLRGHFALALEREGLLVEREGALNETRRLAKSKSDILATLSHEIRNGLAGVAHVLAGAVGAGSRGAPSRDQLKAALAAARDLVEVLDATVDTEVADTGRLVVQRKPLNTNELINDVLSLHRPAAMMKGLEVSARIDPALSGLAGAAVGDAGRVRQVLNNLVGNAVKYSQRGRVEVRAYRQPDDVLRIEVADTGPGLTAEELVAAFQPFERIERTGGGITGAGIGLALARRLATLMDGAVGAESAPGVGSRFWLELPWDHDATIADSDVVAAAAGGPLRILLADGDALQTASMRAVLEQLGHKVLAVSDGRRVLDLLGMGPLDLLMIDATLPGLAGPALIDGIRARSAPVGDLPVVAMTGGNAAEIRAMLEAGADSVLRKPATATAVGRALTEARARADASDRHLPLRSVV